MNFETTYDCHDFSVCEVSFTIIAPVMIVEFDALCELDLYDVPLLVPDGCAAVLRDVPLAAADYLQSMQSRLFSSIYNILLTYL
jgi:hypothetical protein